LETDSATDVLSFPGGDVDPDSGHTNFGDIIVSYPTALSQASNRQGTVQSEIQLLVVHGVLHLMGYDHAGETEKKQMWSLQAKALQALQLDSINPS
jgi:probable rRNA maturation factor